MHPAQEEWTSLAETCNWKEDPFHDQWDKPTPEEQKEIDRLNATEWSIPVDQTRELDPPGPITLDDYLRKHQEVAKKLTLMKPIRTKICPGIPTYNGNRKFAAARSAYWKIKKAHELLTETFDGNINYGTAHQQWVFFNRQCEHGTHLYSAEHTCASCDLDECTLNAEDPNYWAYIKKESDE